MILKLRRDLTAFDKRHGMQPIIGAFLCRFLSICSSERSLDLSPFSHPKALPAQVGLFILKLLRFICHSDESWCAVPSSQLVERGRASRSGKKETLMVSERATHWLRARSALFKSEEEQREMERKEKEEDSNGLLG